VDNPAPLPPRWATLPHRGTRHRTGWVRHGTGWVRHGTGWVRTMKNADVNRTADVDAYMDRLEHPFKAEVQAVREIIKGVDPRITEQVKWNAPTFSYKGYMATFNLHRTQHVLLVWHNGVVLDDPDGLLEGAYPDRRMTYFTGMAEVEARRPALEGLVRRWVELMDRGG
jgi:hypothetical protein